tara:strand:+ start:4797 stop:4955 length:159 start_codon:yes stop_codon:yes gene_type:complete
MSAEDYPEACRPGKEGERRVTIFLYRIPFDLILTAQWPSRHTLTTKSFERGI